MTADQRGVSKSRVGGLAFSCFIEKLRHALDGWIGKQIEHRYGGLE